MDLKTNPLDKVNPINQTPSEHSGNNVIREGKAEIISSCSNKVFYNPVQEFNRDLSIAVLSVFAEEHINEKKFKKRNVDGDLKDDNYLVPPAGVPYEHGIRILEALSATGLRSIRFALEIEGLKEVVANDLSAQAVEAIKRNVAHNEANDIVKTNHGDASYLMYSSKFGYECIDLDPYGSPSRFLDSAVQAVKDGGLLLITCTDMAVLAGNSPETCYIKYGSISLRTPACHEMALRIALQCVASHASRYGRYIVPILSVSVDFYIRLIVKVFTSPAICKQMTSKLSNIYLCVGCKSFFFHPLGLMSKRDGKPPKYSLAHAPINTVCEHCGRHFQVGGPIWSAGLHDKDFIKKILTHLNNNSEKYNTQRRIEGILSLLLEELETPLYCTLDSLCSKVHCVTIPLRIFRSALLNGGYDVSESHAAPNSVKTNAPFTFIWDIIREWVKTHPVGKKRLEKDDVARSLLDKTPGSVDLSIHPESATQAGEVLRFQCNPLPHWGPGYKATSNILEVKEEKRKQQEKKKMNTT
ncbi:tRNA (guanine(26)-N(2))-dimethyltransferase isoform X1 [Halyomorpha halys]|uniref:tRNA (guanine(26)-N(2))-dimethyltransferase isoform X1 n=1 Tax=Halyomorpha halys TaxID=286706 RepID=UPI0006D4DA2D|nr:probable tRNA (guanine(26)-N(2))-dimethyltransferase isoform X1 [Halyomorpha halys]